MWSSELSKTSGWRGHPLFQLYMSSHLSSSLAQYPSSLANSGNHPSSHPTLSSGFTCNLNLIILLIENKRVKKSSLTPVVSHPISHRPLAQYHPSLANSGNYSSQHYHPDRLATSILVIENKWMKWQVIRISPSIRRRHFRNSCGRSVSWSVRHWARSGSHVDLKSSHQATTLSAAHRRWGNGISKRFAHGRAHEPMGGPMSPCPIRAHGREGFSLYIRWNVTDRSHLGDFKREDDCHFFSPFQSSWTRFVSHRLSE